ncbi:hypothetical protein [Tardiphaga sp. P9-11]|uniref:hypothetical protein n=1 Tax=Tardiphaga sp. P9-11 TaxID=2024614 RepID=UPI0011F39412|nr:hypothetical protein [Tardiphaga sp. P9-11]KAA0070015.1 hypothetical protein CIW50_28035 [Tardiphaga sp. P9-11]
MKLPPQPPTCAISPITDDHREHYRLREKKLIRIVSRELYLECLQAHGFNDEVRTIRGQSLDLGPHIWVYESAVQRLKQMCEAADAAFPFRGSAMTPKQEAALVATAFAPRGSFAGYWGMNGTN